MFKCLRPVLFFAGLLAASCCLAAPPLADHPSPYLAMHADDPVAWQVWSPEILARAQREQKLIFISVGYFSCHWCHVMQRESFRDAAIAAFLNKHFIAVKIDRELDPVLDAYLIDFVERTQGVGGWPLNVYLTAEGYPLAGHVYLPPAGFLELLRKLDHAWQTERDSLRALAAQPVPELQAAPSARSALEPELAQGLHRQLRLALLDWADELSGGFGDQAKFPMVPQLRALLADYRRSDDARTREILTLTLDQMAQQGLRDHLGGGFFRYTVDPVWQTPHFEKMLYDNAQIAALYSEAWRILKRDEYWDIAQQTLDFLVRDMQTPQGGMVASLSAVDGAGEEGGYYLWQAATLQQLLTGEEARAARAAWQMDGIATFEAGHLPIPVSNMRSLAERLRLSDEQTLHRLLASARTKLLAARAARTLPVDDKQLTAWNGLALEALSHGLALPEGTRYRRAGKQLRDFLVTRVWNGQRLARSWGARGAFGDAGLEDYVYAAQGLLAWAAATDSKADLALARRWIDEAWARFHTGSGWRGTDNWWLPGRYELAQIFDGPMPSSSATLIRSSLWLADQQQDQALRARAQQALALGSDLMRRNVTVYPSAITLIGQGTKGVTLY